jgi:hypothetical protein
MIDAVWMPQKTRVSKSQMLEFIIFGLVGGTGLEPVTPGGRSADGF